MDVAMLCLREEFGHIPNTLYRTYYHFRDKFTVERGLTPPPETTRRSWRWQSDWAEALLDARVLEAYVADTWATAISEHFTAPV